MPATKKTASAASAAPAAPNRASRSPTVERLAKLGLRTDMALVLHLPMRYEDETTVVPIRDANAMAGRIGNHVVQVEGVVATCEVQFRPRRQLVVTIADDSGGDPLWMRFLNFYGSQAKQLAAGTRVRARGEIRHGFFGAEMVHPSYKVVEEGAPLPDALTPVYPAGEGLSQTILRRAIAAAMTRIDWRDTVPQPVLDRLGLWGFEPSVRLLHHPPPDVDEAALADRIHP
ncbi:MAG: ATP-dependent DNA helicase RecG, partial [Burkholderiaceae bacterium]